MEIRSASFVVSNSVVGDCPAGNLPEYAFIGRSNVGKSSLINMLVNRSNLARTSGAPGKTQLINHFLINENWHLVDLPGYGYAKTSKKNRRAFQNLITDYLKTRMQLISTFVLVDARHHPQKNDMEFMKWMGEGGFPFSIVFTKADKLKKKALERNIEHYKDRLSETWEPLPPYFITSALNHSGKNELLGYIGEINASL